MLLSKSKRDTSPIAMLKDIVLGNVLR
jgi:hypothetical protein